MTRRILLIDPDPEFRATLAQELARYRIEVVVVDDADAAITDASTADAELVVLAVDEPDKVGFKQFQQIKKKGALVKTPIVLITSTVSADAMAKHKGLKTHADDYVDKRTLGRSASLAAGSQSELVVRLGALIKLGPPVEDDLDIPVDIDDIALDDGDVVLDETVGDEAAPTSTVVDAKDSREQQIVAAETDAAFDALLGDFGGDAPELQNDPSQMVAPIEDDGVPAPIMDSKRIDPDPEPEVSVPQVSEPAIIVEQRYESSPAIQLGVDDLQAVEDASGGIPEPVPHPMARDEEDEAPPILVAPLPPPAADRSDIRPDSVVAAPPELAPKFIDSSTQPKFVDASTQTGWPPTGRPPIDLGLDAIAEDAQSEREASGVYDRKGLRKIGELERQIAQLKIELERQRAATSDAGARGSREREFINLKQQLIAKDEEAKRARNELEAKSRELEDAEDRMRQAQQSRMDLEAKAVELEQRVAADGARVTTLEGRERSLSGQLASAQQDLEQRSQAFAAAEAARTQLERDLASERAMRAASTSDAERALRVEREQMIARHQGELASLRQEHGGAVAAAIEAERGEHAKALEAMRVEGAAALDVIRQQLEAARQQHASAVTEAQEQLDASRAQQAAALETAQRDHATSLARSLAALREDHAAQLAATVETARNEIANEAEEAVSQLETQHAGDVARLRDEHVAALGRLTGERDSAIARGAKERDDAVARASSEHGGIVERLVREHAAALQSEATARERAVAEVRGEVDRMRAEVERLRAANEQALAEQAKQHATALADQANQHAVAMVEREREINLARQDEAIAHTAALAELKVELDKQAKLHGIKLDGAKKELDDVLALHEQAKAQLASDKERAQAEIAAAHQAELAQLARDRQRAIDDIARTQAEHRTALDRVAAQHEEELAQQKELADRELAEFKQALVVAKRTLDESSHRAHTEREGSEQTHAQAIAELTAQHERAMALANGEVIKVKAFGDAEHNRAMAAKEAEFDKQRKELISEHGRLVQTLTAERDELQRGLSAARDTIRRSESELASAVQTIADRNAELRTHAAAIAERDQRLADLRKELETVETENQSYQEQVLRAYQKIKADEAMVARAKKAMAIAITVLDDNGAPKSEPT